MTMFTERETACLRAERLGHLATIGRDGQPHVVPTSFRLNSELGTIDLGGVGMGRSKKYRDVRRDGRASFVVDGVDSSGDGHPWGIEIRGRAEAMTQGGQELRAGSDPEFIRLRPTRIVAWGVDTDPFHPNSRDLS